MVLIPYPVIFESAIGSVYTHGVFFAMGVLCAAAVLVKQRHFFHLTPGEVLERVVLIFISGLLASRVGFFVSYPTLWSNVSQTLSFWQGGLVSYWGILAGVGVVLWLGRQFKGKTKWQWYAATLLATLFGWGIGRFGNFFAGDSVGVTSTIWNFFYERIPIQLFESLLCFVLFFTLLPRLRHQPDFVVWWGALGYFAGRLLIDTWRDEAVFWGLHNSQWVSLLALILLLILKYNYENQR